MSERVPPHDLAAEESLIGAVLLTPAAFDDVRDRVLADDFYRPAHQAIWVAVASLHSAGGVIDTTTVAAEMNDSKTLKSSGGVAALIDMQTSTPSATNAASYADLIVAHAARRRVIEVGTTMVDRSFESVPSGDVAEDAITDLRLMLDETASTDPEGLSRLSDFAAADRELSPWVVDGLIRRDWRMMIIAGEGKGKTVLMRQIAIAAASGNHPFNGRTVKAPRILIVDLENPVDNVLETCQPMLATAKATNPRWDTDRLQFWYRDAGIDLRSRSGRSQFVSVLQRCRPDLVMIGPLYKMSRRGRDDFDTEAAELQFFLDNVRSRYGFALIIEHHMPQNRSEGMRPMGSSLWRRWPDLGLGFERSEGSVTAYEVTSWRGDRISNSWPRVLHREAAQLGTASHSGGWPWRAEPSPVRPNDDDMARPAGLPYKDD